MSTSNTFSEEGRLLQIEYAIKNVSKAGTIIGLVCDDGVVLLGINKEDVSDSKEKIYKITGNIFIAVCGLFGDAMLLKKYGQVKAQDFLEEFNVECSLSRLCKFISDKKQIFTQYNQTRPFGVSFLYGGFENGKFRLFSTDPSGTINEWKGVSYGENEDSINKGLRSDLPDINMNMEQGTQEIFKILSKVTECGVKDYKKYEILYLGRNSANFVKQDHIKNILEDLATNK